MSDVYGQYSADKPKTTLRAHGYVQRVSAGRVSAPRYRFGGAAISNDPGDIGSMGKLMEQRGPLAGLKKLLKRRDQGENPQGSYPISEGDDDPRPVHFPSLGNLPAKDFNDMLSPRINGSWNGRVVKDRPAWGPPAGAHAG